MHVRDRHISLFFLRTMVEENSFITLTTGVKLIKLITDEEAK
jgi:hypothetical protein